MKTNFKGTKSSVKVIDCSDEFIIVQESDNIGECDIYTATFDGYYEHENKSNANLFRDALEIRQQIDFDLPELLERYKKLMYLSKDVVLYQNDKRYSLASLNAKINELDQFLNKQ